MLYKVIHDKDVFELNPGLQAVEQYVALTSQQMVYVILSTDPSYDNPIRTLTGRARNERAAVLAGYKMESDGKRLDKNGREIAYGQKPKVEAAIAEFKRNHYDDKQYSIEALQHQIAEIREFLLGSKEVPVKGKGGTVVLDKEGNIMYETDPKLLKLAVELGEKLPNLEKALSDLKALTQQVEPKYEGPMSYTTADLGPDLETIAEGTGSVLDMFNENLKKNDKREDRD